MKRYWRRKEPFDLEAELRASRPQPRSELVHELEARVRTEGRRSPFGAVRLAFVSALTAALLAALAGFGGLGYASSGIKDVAKTAKRIVVKQGPVKVKRSAAADQYKKKAKKKAKKAKKVKKKKKAKARRAGRGPRFTG